MQESTLIAYTVAKRMLRRLCDEARAALPPPSSSGPPPKKKGAVPSASAPAATPHEAALHMLARRSEFFNTHRVHLHCPSGGRPKEGPSAGIGITTSLLSLALDRPARGNLAMTGEVTITGRVLPIGGVKEKTLVAIRARCTDIILPQLNRPDWDELADNIKSGITPHFVDHYDQVFDLALGGPHGLGLSSPALSSSASASAVLVAAAAVSTPAAVSVTGGVGASPITVAAAVAAPFEDWRFGFGHFDAMQPHEAMDLAAAAGAPGLGGASDMGSAAASGAGSIPRPHLQGFGTVSAGLGLGMPSSL